ncbi:MAG: TIGR02099 family protein, partial [Halobacteria archaeon]|nr:TIGR02099 family protein [Halobacteria archaeon]
GILDELDVLLLRNVDAMQVDGIFARFSELGVAETATTPYLAGLDGVISGSAETGTLRIDSRDVDVTDSRVFRDILAVSELHGELSWQRDADATRITTERLAMVNPHMALLGDFRLTLPASGGGTHLDLNIDVESVDLGAISHYLPAKVMSADGVAWLDNSLVSGQVRNGTVRVLGRLDQLPFDNGEGQLEVRLPVFNATLDYNEEWTPITGLDAQVDFTGRSMDIGSQRGRIRTAALQQVRARIQDLAHPRLTIDGSVSGQLPVMLAELGSSPLGERFGGFVDRAIATGTCGLQLDIDIPLSGEQRELSVAGRISLRDNTLKMRDSIIALSDIRGVLAFDDEGIEGDGLKAILFGRPADALVWSEQGKPDTHIRLSGKLGLIDALLEADDPLRKAVTGESDWQILLSVRGAPARGEPGNVGVRVTSSLAGTAIDLPAPLGKDAPSTRPLSIEIDNVSHRDQTVTLAYGEEISGKLLLESRQETTRLQRGMLSLGGGEARLPETADLLIGGRLDVVRLSDWQPWLGRGQDGPAVPLRLDLDIGALEIMGYQVNDLQLVSTSAGLNSTITVSGDSNQGKIGLMRAGQGIEKIVMNMQRLALKKKSTDAVPVTEPGITPADLPALQLNARELVYNDVNFGQFDLKAAPLADNKYQIERLALSSDLLSMRLNGSWHMTGSRHQSRIDLEVTKGRMGDLLDVFGYEKSIKNGELYGTLQVAWSAPLTGFSPEILDGKLAVKIKDGQLLDIEPGAGRALGLLSLGKLPRRLRLDFSDLFGEGFSFERITGNFVLDYGNAYTNDLVVDGPAAKIEISGRVGLVDKDYDELVTVTPYLDSSLPLAGALVGGPAVGAAALVAEKLLEGRFGLNEMAREQYMVAGSWDAPEVTRIVKDTGTDVSDVDIFDE